MRVPRVVQDHQHPPALQDAAVERFAFGQADRDAVAGHAECAQERTEHLGGPGRLRPLVVTVQVGEQLAVGKPCRDAVCPVQREVGLADAGRADHGADGRRVVHAAAGQQSIQSGQFSRAADETGWFQRQLGGQQSVAGRGGTRGGEAQRRIVAQDRVVQIVQGRARLDPDLLDGPLPSGPERLQCLRPPSGPVLREHELRAYLLAQRMLGHHRGEFGNQDRVLAGLQAQRGARLVGGQSLFLKARGLDLHRVSGDVGQGGPAPQVQCGVEQVHGLRPPALAHRVVRVTGQPGEVGRVDPMSGRAQQVAGRHRADDGLDVARRPERLTESRDADGDLRPSGRRWSAVPDGVHQAVDRHDPIRRQQQHGQHGALPRAADDHPAIPDCDFEWTQHAETQLGGLCGH